MSVGPLNPNMPDPRIQSSDVLKAKASEDPAMQAANEAMQTLLSKLNTIGGQPRGASQEDLKDLLISACKAMQNCSDPSLINKLHTFLGDAYTDFSSTTDFTIISNGLISQFFCGSDTTSNPSYLVSQDNPDRLSSIVMLYGNRDIVNDPKHWSDLSSCLANWWNNP
jgi:hypothetical protein